MYVEVDYSDQSNYFGQSSNVDLPDYMSR